VARKFGRPFFFEKKQRVIAERQTFFKNAEVQPSFCSAKYYKYHNFIGKKTALII